MQRLISGPAGIVFMLLVTLPGTVPDAAAQVPDVPETLKPLSLGKFNYYPVFKVEYRDESNLFYRPQGQEVSSRVATVSPGFILQMPFSNSQASLGYVAQYKDYSTDQLNSSTTHFLLADTELLFSNGFYIRLHDDFESGVLDTQRLLGSEVTFLGQEFRSNNLEAEFGFARDYSRNVNLSVSADAVTFSKDQEPQFYDTDGFLVELSGRNQVSRRGWLLWSLSSGETDYLSPEGASFIDEFKNQEDRFARIGWRVEFSPRTYLQIQAGYSKSKFTGNTPSEFSGIVGDVALSRRPVRGLHMIGTISRRVYASLYSTIDYYAYTGLNLRVFNSQQSRISYGCGLKYSIADYPSGSNPSGQPIPDRTDYSYQVDLWSGYRQNDWMEWRITASAGERSSVTENFEFEVRRLGFSLLLGPQ